ncbi:MAG: hypothetical protein AAGE92_07310 [Cyanobacteria bacterium P01_G01_bin.4]
MTPFEQAIAIAGGARSRSRSGQENFHTLNTSAHPPSAYGDIPMKRIHIFGSILTAIALSTASSAAFADSWADAIADDPQAYCSDVGLGHNTDSTSGYASTYNEGSVTQNNVQEVSNHVSGSNSSSSSYYNHRERSGGGGFSFLGIGANGRGSGETTVRRSNSAESAWDNTYASYSDTSSHRTWANGQEVGFEHTSSRLVTGRNCDAVVAGAAAIEITEIETQAAIEINTQNNFQNTLNQLLH